MLRNTYVEINLDHLEFNLKNIRSRIGPDVAIAAVVKADAYGHGAVIAADTILSSGGDCLAVATLTEALELRKNFPKAEILIMGFTPDENLEYAVDRNIVQTIFSLHQAEILDSLGKEHRKIPKVHLKYDTGFNRLGFKPCAESITEIIEITKLPHLSVDGIFSHFALAGDEENRAQFKSFMDAVEKIEATGYRFKYRHICDSISAIDYPEFNLDMIRPGAILYGLKSFRKNDINLKQVMSFKTRIYHLKTIKKGEGVSYNYKWKARRKTLLATLPVGYCDGYPRNMYSRGVMTVRSQRVPVVGVICMDQCMIDVTDLPNVRVGDEVIIFGDGTGNTLDVAEVAQLGETNKNEIISRITRRTPRVYLKAGTSAVKYYLDVE